MTECEVTIVGALTGPDTHSGRLVAAVAKLYRPRPWFRLSGSLTLAERIRSVAKTNRPTGPK